MAVAARKVAAADELSRRRARLSEKRKELNKLLSLIEEEAGSETNTPALAKTTKPAPRDRAEAIKQGQAAVQDLEILVAQVSGCKMLAETLEQEQHCSH